MKNKRAFTLTEIIAVVVIIGLLVAIVIPAVSSYVKSGKERVNKSNATTLEIAARDYFDKNKIELPEPGQAISVLGSFLRDNSILVNDLKDADGGNCDNSYVVVSNNEGDYDYHACMKCDNYNTANGDELCETYDPSSDDESSGGDIGDENLNCDFIFNKIINSEFNAADLEATVRVNSKNKIKSITVNNAKVSFNQNKNNNMYEGLASYKFNKTNRYLAKATVTDIKGRTVTCSNKYIDSITDPFPTIETINVDNDKPTIEVGASSEAWANKDKEAIIPITITDTGSGINLDSFTLDNIKIKQYVINESDPSLISNRILTIPNETVLEYDEENSVTNKATKTYKYNLKIKGIETSGKIELEVGPVSDNVGNQSPIKVFPINTIKLAIDNVKPTCELIKNNINYRYGIYAISNDTYEASAVCSDTYGICTNKTKKLIQSFTEEGKYTPDFKVRDKAGNETICPKYNVIIDKTAPTCRISTTDDGVYANYKKLSLTVEDNLTYVSSSLEGTYYNPSTNTNESWGNNHINPAIITSYNPEESSTIEMFNISKNGTYKVNIVDDAGNTSYCQLPVTHVDNVAPTIELTNLNLDTIESITEDNKQVKVGQIKANITDISSINNIDYTYTMEGYSTDLGIGEMTKKSDGYYYSNSIKYPGLHTITVKDNSKIYQSVNDIGTSNYTTGNTATATTNSYMIDFNLTGGTVSTPTSMIKMEGVNRTLAAPSQSGYTFDGWYENSYGSGTKYSSPFYLERNRDLYGKMEQEDTQNPSCSIVVKSGTAGNKVGTVQWYKSPIKVNIDYSDDIKVARIEYKLVGETSSHVYNANQKTGSVNIYDGLTSGKINAIAVDTSGKSTACTGDGNIGVDATIPSIGFTLDKDYKGEGPREASGNYTGGTYGIYGYSNNSYMKIYWSGNSSGAFDPVVYSCGISGCKNGDSGYALQIRGCAKKGSSDSNIWYTGGAKGSWTYFFINHYYSGTKDFYKYDYRVCSNAGLCSTNSLTMEHYYSGNESDYGGCDTH